MSASSWLADMRTRGVIGTRLVASMNAFSAKAKLRGAVNGREAHGAGPKPGCRSLTVFLLEV